MIKVEILEQKGFDFLWITDADGPCLGMWTIPEEIRAQKYMADQAYGHVIVAGYGLGIVQKHLSENSRVTEITTIELYEKVVNACEERYGIVYGDIIIGDFNKPCFDTLAPCDCVVGDIWQDIIPEALDDYKRFKISALRYLRPHGRIIAWGQELFEYMIEVENGLQPVAKQNEHIQFLRTQVQDIKEYGEQLLKENRKLKRQMKEDKNVK